MPGSGGGVLAKRPVFEAEFCLEVKEHRISSVDVSDNHIEVGNKYGMLMNYETQYAKFNDVSVQCIFNFVLSCL